MDVAAHRGQAKRTDDGQCVGEHVAHPQHFFGNTPVSPKKGGSSFENQIHQDG